MADTLNILFEILDKFLDNSVTHNKTIVEMYQVLSPQVQVQVPSFYCKYMSSMQVVRPRVNMYWTDCFAYKISKQHWSFSLWLRSERL